MRLRRAGFPEARRRFGQSRRVQALVVPMTHRSAGDDRATCFGAAAELLDDPDAGSFVFNGTEVAHYNERKRADLRKHNIGFVF